MQPVEWCLAQGNTVSLSSALGLNPQDRSCWVEGGSSGALRQETPQALSHSDVYLPFPRAGTGLESPGIVIGVNMSLCGEGATEKRNSCGLVRTWETCHSWLHVPRDAHPLIARIISVCFPVLAAPVRT